MKTIRITKKILLAGMLLLALFLWPVHPIRQVTSVRSGDEGHQMTAPIAIGESISQSFRATDDNLIQLEFVFTFDGELPCEGELLFELLDDQKETIFTESLDYDSLQDYGYGGPVINLMVKKGKIYTYRITNESITENLPCGVYTTRTDMCHLKKGTITFRGESCQGELLTRITTNHSVPFETTLALWGCIGLTGFMIYEILNRLEERTAAWVNKKQGGQEQ